MKSGAHTMLKLKKGYNVAFAEKENREILLRLRKTDSRMKGGRISEVLQCAPSAIKEGHIYEGS